MYVDGSQIVQTDMHTRVCIYTHASISLFASFFCDLFLCECRSMAVPVHDGGQSVAFESQRSPSTKVSKDPSPVKSFYLLSHLSTLIQFKFNLKSSQIK